MNQQVELWMGRCIAVLDLPTIPLKDDRILRGSEEYEVMRRSFNHPDPTDRGWTVRLYVRVVS